MPKQDNNAAEQNEGFEVVAVVLVANHKPTKVLQPGEQPLDFPASPVAPQWPSVLRLVPVLPIWRNHLDPSLGELLVERVRVVGLVANELLGIGVEEAGVEGFFDERGLVRRSTLDADGERKTSAVCHCHDLGPLAALGLPDMRPPFLAGAKVPSMKHSERSKPPRSSRSLASASSTRRKTPAWTHCWKRRWQVVCGGYLSGKSFHGAPVRKIQRIPLSTARVSFHGRPRPSSHTGGSGINGSSIAHCSSVRSMLADYPILAKSGSLHL